MLASVRPMAYQFDRYLRYDELVEWLHKVAAAHPQLVALANGDALVAWRQGGEGGGIGLARVRRK